MPQKWNLQDIKPAASKPASSRQSSARKAQADIAPRTTRAHSESSFDTTDLTSKTARSRGGGKQKHKAVAVVVVLLILFFFLINVVLGGATVTVYPHVKEVVIDSEFSAFKEPQPGQLAYELLTLEATAEKQVKASGKENVSLQAAGQITVYNENTAVSQRLITNTRFETPDGLIFRIKDSIEVPKATKSSDGEVIPGKIQATVFSDGTGDQYNVAPVRFTVPGLKGGDQYDAVYAESTATFTGGFEGEKYNIAESELTVATEQIHDDLRNQLLESLNEQIPSGFIAYNDAVTFVFETLPATEYGDSLATIKERAKLHVPIFKSEDLATYLAEESVSDYTQEPVSLMDYTTLTFSYTDQTMSYSDISVLSQLDFTLKGNTKLVWRFDEATLKDALLEKSKSEAGSVFLDYKKSISNAQVEVKPFWATSFPDTPEDIEIITVID